MEEAFESSHIINRLFYVAFLVNFSNKSFLWFQHYFS